MEVDLGEIEGLTQSLVLHFEDGTTTHGECLLKGRETVLKIYSHRELFNDLMRLPVIHAELNNGTKASFINNIIVNKITHGVSEKRRHTFVIMPHYIVFGRDFHQQSTNVISSSFLINDAPTIYYDFDTFNFAFGGENEIMKIISSISREKFGRDIEIGDRPIIAYFSGKREVFSCLTCMGRISAFHAFSVGARGPRGVSITNEIVTRVEFGGVVQLQDLIDVLMPLLRFLNVVAGRLQSCKYIRVEIQGDDNGDDCHFYWCWKPTVVQSDGDTLHPTDLPVNGGLQPDAFGRVLANWLQMDAERLDARVRFASCLRRQRSYDTERLVAAANMFDILPIGAVPQRIELDESLIQAREFSRKHFRNLEKSPGRDSILSALGRLGQPNLKDKIRHRASLVKAAAGEILLPDLIYVTDLAVNCRNHYVHGTDNGIDYSSNFQDTTVFFTDVLEFVFSVSEFVESGWDLQYWYKNGASVSHPWGALLYSYSARLQKLKSLGEAGAF